MGVENKFKPSKKKWQQESWFWPAIYGAMALLIIAAIYSYTQLSDDAQSIDSTSSDFVKNNDGGDALIPVNQSQETMKYPMKEELLDKAVVVQEFYDINASKELQQNALLVFNQTFTTSNGISISVDNQPFPVVAAMSGEVKEVLMDPFTGNKITILHSDGYETIYSSVDDVLVKAGDVVKQGEQIAITIENESNPQAGVHLHFQVKKDGVFINPKSLLAFN